MAKDPAFLFYPGDYLKDTQCLSEKSQVAYDRIMCEHMRNISEHMNNIIITKDRVDFFTKRLSDDEKSEVFHVLKKVGDGFQIEWVAESICKRKSYSESRAKNREGKTKKHMLTYEPHMEDANENENRNVLEEIGSEKIKEIANEVWKDQIWKEQICIGLSLTMDELKKWLAQFNSSIASDAIPEFDKGKYKKMSRGWISSQKAKGVTIEKSGLTKKTDAPPLTHLKAN